MESAVILRSFHCSVSTVAHVKSVLEKPGVVPMCNATSNKTPFTQGLSGRCRARKGAFLQCIKASETTLAAKSDVVSLETNSREPVEKKNMYGAIFPNGFEALVLEVCDETEVAELKLKIGDFEMNLKRNIGGIVTPAPIVSPSMPTAVPSKPMVDSSPASSSLSPPKSSPETTSPFKNISSEKSSKLASLEASGSNGYVLVSSPTVGSFRRGRTVKGKKQPPICKVGDLIKEGQVIGYLDQFGSEIPVRSDVAGEVLKLLYNDGEAIGYGDPLIAVLPSFHGIK